jgi:hypothetical protein
VQTKAEILQAISENETAFSQKLKGPAVIFD